MLKIFKKVLFMAALLGYLNLVFLGLFGMLSHMHENIPIRDCPYSLGSHTICSMTILDHINIWKSFVNLPLLLIFSLVLFATYAYSFLKIKEISPPLIGFKKYKNYFSNLYSQLYSSGILNPKIP